jgi:hypothetical protein
MLRRYQIPDCLLIITQRPTKYLTLIESMIGNSKEEKKDTDLLVLVLEKLKIILRRVNDNVAFYQNSNEFKKIYDLIDPKSFTYVFYHSLQQQQQQIQKSGTLTKQNSTNLDLQKKFTKTDLLIHNNNNNNNNNNGSSASSTTSSGSSSTNSSGVNAPTVSLLSNSPSIKSSSSSSSLSSLTSSSSSYYYATTTTTTTPASSSYSSEQQQQQRKIIAINQVNVKYMSNNNKIYKDVTCLTMNDIIVFLQLNEKGKLVFINENSVIPCTNGILIRPKLDELTSNQNRISYSSSLNISTTNNNNNSSNINNQIANGLINNNNNTGSINNNSNNNNNNNATTTTTTTNSSNIISYIVNTITNEIVEIKFPDESSRNQWATLVHTHITPFIGGG